VSLLNESSAEKIFKMLTEDSRQTTGQEAFFAPAEAWQDCLALANGIRETDQETSTVPSEIDAAIARRRSTKSFSGKQISRMQIDYIIRSARRAAPTGSSHTPDIDVVLPLEGEGGLGVFEADADGLSDRQLPVGFTVLSQLHMSYLAAPAILLVSGRVMSSGSDYRSALLAASCSGYTAWLAASVIGLDGSVFGWAHGGISDAIRARRGCGFRHLFTVAIGARE
jgi:hypothetical protein